MRRGRLRITLDTISVLVAAAVLLGGCVVQEKDEAGRAPAEARLAAGDYFPAAPGMRWAYTGRGNEFATYERLATHRREERVQIVHVSGAIVAFVYEIHPDRIVLRAIRSEIDDVAEEFLDVPDELSQVILQEPLAEGAEWRTPSFVRVDDEGDGERYVWELRRIEAVDLNLTTPAGAFPRVIRVRVIPDQGSESLEYYAPGVGLVKTEYFLRELPGESIVSELATFEAGRE